MDKRIEKGEVTRELILLKAIEMIANEGIGSLSSAKLAEACHISKSNVFHHFKNVDAILNEVAQLVMIQTLYGLEIEGENIRSYLENVSRGLLEVSEEEMLMYRAYFAVYNHGLFNAGYNALIKDQTAKLIDSLSNKLLMLSIKQRKEDAYCEELLREKSHWCAVHFLAFMDGLGLQKLLVSSPSKETYEKVISMEINLIEQVLSEV